MKRVKLGSVLKIMHGYAFKSENYTKKSKYRLVTLGNFQESNNCFQYNESKATYYSADFPEDYILKNDDLILPLTEQTVGLFGNSAFIPYNKDFNFVLNQRVGKVICDEEKLNKKYAHFLLATKSIKNQLEARATGTRQRNISPKDVYDVTANIPDIKEQITIGEFLYNLEKKQLTNTKIIAELESMARLIYNYWFVQFDFPDENNRPLFSYILERISKPFRWAVLYA